MVNEPLLNATFGLLSNDCLSFIKETCNSSDLIGHKYKLAMDTDTYSINGRSNDDSPKGDL